MRAGDERPQGLHRNGLFWATLASLLIAALLAGAILSELAFDLNCRAVPSRFGGATIARDAAAETAAGDYGSLWTKRGRHRDFPPGTECLLYGRPSPSSSQRFYAAHLVAARYYPSATDYLWIPVYLLLPFAVLLLVRLARHLRRRARPRAGPAG